MHAVDSLSARRRQTTDRWVGRALLIVFAASAVIAALGVVGAIGIAPARVLMEPGAAALTVVLFGAIAAFALAMNWRATRRLAATLAAAESEIVERIAAEGRLRETSEILSAILTSSPVATQAFDREGRVIVWNPASERTFGWSAEELVGRPLPEAMVPRDERAAAHPGTIRPVTESTTTGRRVRRLTKDGDERWVDLYAAPLVDRDGSAIGVAGQMVDVTDRVRIDAQLAQAQKMGAVGLLASGIAHDFNNTLAAAAGYAELIRSGSDGEVRADATTLLGVVDRGRELTRQLLAFARGSDGPPAVVDLRDVVLGIEPLIRRLIGETVAVEVTLPSEALPARIQVGQLEQSLINLAINGRDAMPGGGRLRIAVDVAGAADGQPATDPGITTAVAVGCSGPTRIDDVRVTVSDSGTGIPPAVVTRIFEPFFTTKPIGAGTGLGLAMVRGFVETARGSLVVTSGPQIGTAITIRLPRAAQA
jgi:PAS domain S-box-containing protein